jgi:hypothetical protein
VRGEGLVGAGERRREISMRDISKRGIPRWEGGREILMEGERDGLIDRDLSFQRDTHEHTHSLTLTHTYRQ